MSAHAVLCTLGAGNLQRESRFAGFLKGLSMDLARILADLRRERDAIDVALLNLEQLARIRKQGTNRPTHFSTKGHTNGTNGSYENLTPEENR
jgi:hypothetical protein